MQFLGLDITIRLIIESTILYGIVHGNWKLIKWSIKYLQTDSVKIINQHVKDGHNSRLKHCVKNSCFILGTALDSSHQVKQSKKQEYYLQLLEK
jgi:hypothetical protein